MAAGRPDSYLKRGLDNFIIVAFVDVCVRKTGSYQSCFQLGSHGVFGAVGIDFHTEAVWECATTGAGRAIDASRYGIINDSVISARLRVRNFVVVVYRGDINGVAYKVDAIFA